MMQQTRPADPTPGAHSGSPDRLPLRIVGREAWGGFKIALTLLVAACVVAVLLLGAKLALIGAFVGFIIMGFVGLPMWLASLQDDLSHTT